MRRLPARLRRGLQGLGAVRAGGGAAWVAAAGAVLTCGFGLDPQATVATVSPIAVCPSWPQACIIPALVSRYCRENLPMNYMVTCLVRKIPSLSWALMAVAGCRVFLNPQPQDFF